MVIMEAFEFGLPVIAYHMGAMDLIIDDGKTGFLPEAFDPHKFAQAMLKLAHVPGCLRMPLPSLMIFLSTRQ